MYLRIEFELSSYCILHTYTHQNAIQGGVSRCICSSLAYDSVSYALLLLLAKRYDFNIRPCYYYYISVMMILYIARCALYCCVTRDQFTVSRTIIYLFSSFFFVVYNNFMTEAKKIKLSEKRGHTKNV